MTPPGASSVLTVLAALLLVPALSSAQTYRNSSGQCDQLFRLRGYTSVELTWRPGYIGACLLDASFSANMLISLRFDSRHRQYDFSGACRQEHPVWKCEPQCKGLWYARAIGGSPMAVYAMSVVKNLRLTHLRLLSCSPEPVDFNFVISASPVRPSQQSGDDPVWRILGPVLATVCIMAAVFLVCVCYAQNFYQREPACCRRVYACLRRLFRCEAEVLAPAQTTGDAAAGGGGVGDASTSSPASGFVPPHIAAQELRAYQDRPPPYEEFHKYHRRASFATQPTPPTPPPPPYDDAVDNLLREEAAPTPIDLGGSPRRTPQRSSSGGGFENRAYQPDIDRPRRPGPCGGQRLSLTAAVEVCADAITLEVDLGEGSDARPVSNVGRVERRHSHLGTDQRSSNC